MHRLALQLPLDLRDFQASDSYGWTAVIRNTVPLFALLALAPWIADHSLAAAWLLMPFTGVLLYRLTIVMHDCTHGSLFRSSRLNHAVGLLLGAITGIDFHRFRAQHWRHHRLYGQSEDPQGFHYLGVERFNRARFIWHVVKPLLGANVPHVMRESLVYPRNFWRALRRGDAAFFIVVQLVIFLIVTRGVQHPSLAFMPATAAATFGLFFSQLRGLAEHGPLNNSPVPHLVRSHSARALERLFLYDLHFNYHAAHHRWPSCPSLHLPSIHDRYLATHSKLHHSMVETLIAIATKRNA